MTIVSHVVRAWKQQTREVFLPLRFRRAITFFGWVPDTLRMAVFTGFSEIVLRLE